MATAAPAKPAPTKSLTAAMARALLAAEEEVADLKRRLESAEDARALLRARYRDRAPDGELIEVGGIRVKRTRKTSGRSFRITEYLKSHKLTAAMRGVDSEGKPFLGGGSGYDFWSVKQVEEEAEKT